MTARRASDADVDGPYLKPLVREGLASGRLALAVDERKLVECCRAMTRDHYAEVAEEGGRLVAYIAGQVFEHPWLNRCQLNIVGWYSIRPGAGVLLMRRCLRWAEQNPNVTTVSLWVNEAHEERAARILKILSGREPARVAGLVLTV